MSTAVSASALLSGSFLSGAMACMSIVTVPVLLDTIPTAPQLFQSWARLYHYGHILGPTGALGTLGLWMYAAAQRRAAEKSWRAFALAGVMTISIVPFTIFVMVPTNNELFRLKALGSELGNVTLANGRNVVTKWAWMHLARSALPLIGTIIGAFAVFGDRA
ncbi:hypothetical protein B0I35DRAFT_420871 [Stachybotrys elegans]|uniref:Noranthrone monooxygenase n=1 Tax=Stachybotrys elegans TaxID=80388 RepID=A0A8K0T360_9HYPO|nr:hypothetical protein B0I35DRAFT_420871 [Stachybotrys elegans]